MSRRLIQAVVVVLALAPGGVALAQSEGNPTVTDEELEQEERQIEECGDPAESDGCDPDDEYEGPADGEEPSGGGGSGGGGARTAQRPRDTTVPKVTRVRVLQVLGGKRVSFRLSERADVTLVFERCTVFRGVRCIHWSRSHTRVDQRGKRGRNSALVGAGSLRNGRWRVEVHAVDGGHHHSNVGRAVFQVR